MKYNVTVQNIDFAALKRLDHYELNRVISQLREWFPDSQFDIELNEEEDG